MFASLIIFFGRHGMQYGAIMILSVRWTQYVKVLTKG